MRARLGVGGHAQAQARIAEFSWEQSADAMRGVLETVHAGGRASGLQ